MKIRSFNIHTILQKYFSGYLSMALLFGITSCKKQLDVKDPNDPTFSTNVVSEAGLTAYAKGGIYWNGFNYGDVWLGDSYFSLPWGYHELMGDVVGGGQGSNNQTTTMGVPDYLQADPNDASTIFNNASPQVSIIRSFNTVASTGQGNNALYYEWLNMYAMIYSCNLTLDQIAKVPALSPDKANTVKAWAYWWKGYAYAQIGTLYIAGVIIDTANSVVSNYINHNDVIAESNKQLNLALSTLGSIRDQDDYTKIITQLIPAQNQKELGRPLSSIQFKRTINTMLARNVLLNHLTPFVKGDPNASISKSAMSPMTNSDWQAIITYCNNGIKEGDYVFTGRTSASNSFFSANGGSVAGMLTASNQTTSYKLSERLVQNFKSGDNRLANFTTSNGTFYGDANSNTTRYSLVDGVKTGLTGIPVLGSRQVGALEIFIGPTYEENALMLAEANIRTGNIETGLGYIDAVRNYQNAGVAATKGAGLALSDALQELTMERLAALALRGLSFYDLRRWGWTYSIANGGGRYGATLIYNKKLYTNATINYNFMDYWDVPADETDKNKPAVGSTAIVNPNY
jgi:starch-binding outer membrane protein, SusD/RagB family